ncbi:hypothetical protein SAMN02745146_2546 [Hymenobacter daecheongensis DSM 21074]|uniref:Uncharacterized protein n=1 Tax=Hymenobacter daecheongensis DSM 21074 TaxID=1121955 RepID=A0A1M6HKW8_9BACT|nr:hypothetical protein [Hymenobacter daecheongensis]SHJ22858.1 hypothetical protein SAMN02745146_2546 [Hymenobacter daecheongensis DSM 21074]
MPKTIDYPRTSYLSAWEIAEVVDDTGGKCALETCARKLSRKVSGSFKAIVGSAVKFGLVTSKRELLTTTNLFRRIKHAYDKQEEKIYHREAFLHPPLFTHICRKFRNRELPVHMFDVMLIREFGVEEINAQNVAKAFVEGARMVGVIDERNIIADIDMLAAQQTPRRELASTEMPLNIFKQENTPEGSSPAPTQAYAATPSPTGSNSTTSAFAHIPALRNSDAVSSLFGLDTSDLDDTDPEHTTTREAGGAGPEAVFVPAHSFASSSQMAQPAQEPLARPMSADTLRPADTMAADFPTGGAGAEPQAQGLTGGAVYTIRITGPGLDTQLSVQDTDDLAIAGALLEKIRRQLSR